MSETKSCGNCRYFKDEDADGKGYCENFHGIFRCDEVCVDHDVIDNGWTEITPDNVDEIRKNEKNVVVMNQEWDEPSTLCEIPTGTLELYAKWGGCYYYVLPELKIKDE